MTREERIKSALLPILEKMREHGATDEMCKMYGNGFHVGAMWADARPHWISVEEGLPKEGQSCIILIDRKALQGMPRIRSAVYAPNVMMQQEGFAYNRMSKKHHVTHWMPLPQAPTVAKNATVKVKGDAK